MYLKSCCALFLLALVACQAAPSPKVIENSISEAENAILQEETGVDKGRAKKSATTFCVEVRDGKQEKVPCRQEVRQELAKPVVYVHQVPVPAPVVYRKPIAIPPPPPPSPSITLNQQQQQQSQTVNYPPPPPSPSITLNQQQQQQQSQTVNYPPPAPQPAPVPAPAPVQTPAPAQIPIINIVPQAPAPAPCDKPIVQPQQPQQIHTVHHVIHPQSQPPQRPSVTVIQQEVKPQKPELKPQQEFNCSPQRPTCRKCNGLLPQSEPLSFVVQPVQPRPVFYNVRPIGPKDRYDTQQTNEESYDCNCRSGDDSSIPSLTPYITSGFYRSQEPRTIVHHDGATFESPMPYRSAMMSTENNYHRMMSDQPIFFPSEETHRGMEGRHRKRYPPVNLSVQIPIVYPGSGNSPKYYEPVYQPSYTNPYAYPSSYQAYGNYGSSYPVSYGSQASDGVPAITVNAGGPFYRESQHTDSSSQSNEMEIPPGEAHSTATEMIDPTINQKREIDTTQLKNEQEEITQKEK